MKIVVFGGTGSVGRLVVDQALDQGHEVTVFTRDATSVEATHPRLRVEQGDVLDARAVAPVVVGQDAVVVTLGAGRKGGVRSAGTATVIDAMQQAGARRLVVQSTLGVGDSRGNLSVFWKYVMFALLLRGAYADHVEQERVTRRSGLDWTIVRPAEFTDGPHTGRYLSGFGPGEETALKISRPDVADFLVRQVTDDRWLHGTPALAYSARGPR